MYRDETNGEGLDFDCFGWQQVVLSLRSMDVARFPWLGRLLFWEGKFKMARRRCTLENEGLACTDKVNSKCIQPYWTKKLPGNSSLSLSSSCRRPPLNKIRSNPWKGLFGSVWSAQPKAALFIFSLIHTLVDCCTRKISCKPCHYGLFPEPSPDHATGTTTTPCGSFLPRT